MEDKSMWDELVTIGGEYLTLFDSAKMLEATRPLKKAGPAE